MYGRDIYVQARARHTRGNQSCGFHVIIFGADTATRDPQVLARQDRIRRSHPNFMERMLEIASFTKTDDEKRSQFRKRLCEIMLEMSKAQPGVLDSYWMGKPDDDVLASGMATATLQNIQLPDGELGCGDQWAISVLDPSTQCDEGYLRVLVGFFGDAISFGVIVKELRESKVSVKRKRGEDQGQGSEPEEDAAKIRHCEILDVKGNGVPLAIWLLYNIEDGTDPLNSKNHFEALVAVEPSRDEERSSLIFLDALESGNDLSDHSGDGSGGGVGGLGPDNSSGGGLGNGDATTKDSGDAANRSVTPPTPPANSTTPTSPTPTQRLMDADRELADALNVTSDEDEMEQEDAAARRPLDNQNAQQLLEQRADILFRDATKAKREFEGSVQRQNTRLQKEWANLYTDSYEALRGASKCKRYKETSKYFKDACNKVDGVRKRLNSLTKDLLDANTASGASGAASRGAGPARTGTSREVTTAAADGEIRGYSTFPFHRVLVLDEVHWDDFEKQFKLVEFRSGERRNIIPGMYLLLSCRLALRRNGKTCLLQAEVVDVPILSVDDAYARFPLAAAACNLRRLSASWRSNLVTCIVVQNVRPAPEFVFLAKGNQGFLHQFSRKRGTPQFCAAEDVGKRVSVLLDSDRNCRERREVQHMLVESIGIRLTDDIVRAARGRREGLQLPTSLCGPDDNVDASAAGSAQGEGEMRGECLSFSPNTGEGDISLLECLTIGILKATISKEAYGFVSGKITVVSGQSVDCDCNVHEVCVDDKSRGFYALLAGARVWRNDESLWQSLQCDAVLSSRMDKIAQLCENEDLGCPDLREQIFIWMQERQREESAVYDLLWKSMPSDDVLGEGQATAKSLGRDIAGNLGIGDAWALAVLSPDTQLDDGYLQVVSDMLGGAVMFAAISKEPVSKRSNGSSCSAEQVLDAGSDSYEYVHRNDITDGKGRRPLLVWPLLKIGGLNRQETFDLLIRRTRNPSSLKWKPREEGSDGAESADTEDMDDAQAVVQRQNKAANHLLKEADDSSDDDVPLQHRAKILEQKEAKKREGDEARVRDVIEGSAKKEGKDKALVGDVVQVYWTAYKRWCQGTVKALSDGTAKKPRASGMVPSGHYIVDYEDGGEWSHALDASKHEAITKKGDPQHLAWRLVSLRTGSKDNVTHSVVGGSEHKKRAVQGAPAPAAAGAPAPAAAAVENGCNKYCNPCGLDGNKWPLLLCSKCKCSYSCLACLRVSLVADAGEWSCDTCRSKLSDRRPTWDPSKLLPPSKCKNCQTPISKTNDVNECKACGSCLCHDCGCTLEGDKADLCWVCLGQNESNRQHSRRIEVWSQGNSSGGLKAKDSDQFGLMVYRLRMQNCFRLVAQAEPALSNVLRKEASKIGTLPCLTPSQLNHFIGMYPSFDLRLMESVSTAYSRSANREAEFLVSKCKIHVQEFACIPKESEIFKLGLLIGDAGNHPLMDLIEGEINYLLDNSDQLRVTLVVLLFGKVDRRLKQVKNLLAKAAVKGKVVDMGELTVNNWAKTLSKAREEQLHATVDLIGSADGSALLRSILAAGIAPMQVHHLNTPYPQFPADKKGNGWIVSDSVMLSPDGELAKTCEPIFQVSCWMNPLSPADLPMTATREMFGLDPDKLYLVFPALNSKMDQAAAEIWAAVLARTGEDVLLWFNSYPQRGAINLNESMKEYHLWKDEYDKRVVHGQHLPKDLHWARLAAFANCGRGAIFLNVCLTYPAHTTAQEAICWGIFVICLIMADAWSTQRAASTFMHQLGLADLIANDQEGVLKLVEYWCHPEQDNLRKKIRDDLQKEYRDQTGAFFDQARIPSEIMQGFRMIARNSLDEFPAGDQVSTKAVDARLSQFAPMRSRLPDRCVLQQCLTLSEPSTELQLLMGHIVEKRFFHEWQLPLVERILGSAVRNGIIPVKVVGTGGYTVVIGCAKGGYLNGALSVEHHPVYANSVHKNFHNSEICRGAFAEAAFSMRLFRSDRVKVVETPKSNGDFSSAFGYTRPVGGKGEVVVFRYRFLLKRQLREIFKELFSTYLETGEFDERVRITMQTVHNGVGYMNDKGFISHNDISPANLFIRGSPEDHDQCVVLADLGSAAVHALPGQTTSHPACDLRRHSTAHQPDKHSGPPKGISKKRKNSSSDAAGSSEASGQHRAGQSSKAKDEGFVFWGRGDVTKFFNREAEKGRLLKSLRGGTPPYRDTTVNSMPLTPALGQHIDLFSVHRMLLLELAPCSRGEKLEDWDQAARKASVSTEAMDGFIISRMPENLRAGHPRQPLMWGRLLNYLVKGLQPFSHTEPDKEVTLSKLATCLFLEMPILEPADDRMIAAGGHFEVPGGDLYGTGIPDSLLGKLIKKVRIQLISGKGIGAVAGHRLQFGDLIGIYVASRVGRLDPRSESRFAVSIMGDNYTYVARFTPQKNVRWYIEKKKSTGPFFNAPSPGQIANCKLDRENAWDDDQDMDLGHNLIIIPIVVISEVVNEDEELVFTYNPRAGRKRNFPID